MAPLVDLDHPNINLVTMEFFIISIVSNLILALLVSILLVYSKSSNSDKSQKFPMFAKA
jgi:ethanolamine transporter EutH